MTSNQQLIPLPASVWLVCHPGNRPYLGKLYEDREAALHAKQSYEVVVEVRVATGEYAELEDRYCKEVIVKNEIIERLAQLLRRWIKGVPLPPEWHWSFQLNIDTVNALNYVPPDTSSEQR